MKVNLSDVNRLIRILCCFLQFAILFNVGEGMYCGSFAKYIVVKKVIIRIL